MRSCREGICLRLPTYYTPATVETIARAVMAADWPTVRVSVHAGAGPLQAETSDAEGRGARGDAGG